MRRIAGALMAMMMAATAGAQATMGAKLLVLAKHDEMLAIVDPATFEVVAKVPAGGNPHEVIASEDGRTAFITNYGNGSLDTITVVNLTSATVARTLALGPLWGPHGLARAGGRIYFTAEREKLIGRLADTGAAAAPIFPVDWLLGTGQTGTHMLWVSADQTEIATVNVGSGSMDLFTRRPVGPDQRQGGPPSKAGGTTTHGGGAPVPDWDQTIVKVGGLPEGFDVLTDAAGHARTLWVANAKEGTVSVIDWATKSVTRTLAADVPTANRLKFTPDGRLALISREKSGELTVLDVASGKVVKRIVIGTGAAGVLIQPDGRRAYVSCSPDNKVAVVDLTTMQVAGEIHPGTEPDGLAWVLE